ncbi:hypothetical protein AB0M48_13775 [Lentzea sp. NPDC051208]|uniref:hypothetical protein n=1 Tax=Lentzea sp. NPDC051208 TaxID=3154642 RepID=UPI00341F74F5
MTEPENVPKPPAEYDVPAEEYDYDDDAPGHPWKPPFEFHDAEDRLPPPVSGSID